MEIQILAVVRLLATLIAVGPKISVSMVLYWMVIVKPTPLILPDVSLESKLATLLNYLDIALIHEDAFIEKCEKATVHAISEHRKAALQELDDEL